MAGGNLAGGKHRLYVLAALLFLWLFAVGCRLIQLQVINYADWWQRAQRQQQRTIEVSPRRGILYDRNGHELAMSVMVDSVFAVPGEIPDAASTASLLAKVLGGDPREILARLKASHTFAWIARKVDAETGQRIRALNLRGVYFQKEPKRFYPKRELAAQVLGYVGMDDEGLGGIEYAFDSRLRGKPGRMYITMDARRRWFGRVERQPDPGDNVVLTIDEKIQYIAERELERAMHETRAEAGTVIVQNPHSGEVLALANRPTFNPNRYREAPREALKNRAVSDIYEPGSTFKVVTISGALEEKLTKPDEVIDCQMGAIYIAGVRIRDHEKLGLLTVSQVMAKSSDVGAIKLGLRLGEQRFYDYIRGFGFGAQTGIELPGETRGMTKPVNRWSKVSIGAISMGQEIGISGVQLVSAVSAIANDGVWSPPRIVAGFTAPRRTAQTVVFQPAQQRRVVSPMTAVQLKKMLEDVVLFGTGKKAILDGYSSGGKTGTAQKVDPATGAYSKSRYVGSFVGFAPVNNPVITVAVILDSAVGLHQGGQIAAPVFSRIAQQVLAYMNVPHDVEPNPKRLQLRAAVKDNELNEESPDRIGGGLELPQNSVPEPLPAAPMASSLPGEKLVPAAVTSSKPVSAPVGQPQPAPPPESPPGNGTAVVDVGNSVVVPSLLGKSLRSAIEAAQEAGLELEAIGSGIAREQSPAAGTRIPAGRRVSVRFAR